MAVPGSRVRVLNLRDQPLELHLGAEVKILPPHGSAEFDVARLATPQVGALVARHLVHLVPAAPLTPSGPRASVRPPPEPAPRRSEPRRRPPRSKTRPTMAGKRAGKGAK